MDHPTTAEDAPKVSPLLIHEIPIDRINADAMIRDRSILDAAEMDELRISIRATGLRLPIEVLEAEDGHYDLISGYRRLMAVRDLWAIANEPEFQTIKAIIRPRTDLPAAFSAMVEENVVRANLSPFERGRIAVIAAQQGAFGSTEEAVNALFKSASASKRSKVRSFAEVYELLGDAMSFPETLSERRGLRLAAALRQGAEARARDALGTGQGTTPDLEWALLEHVIEEVEAGPVKLAKMGRPRVQPPAGWAGKDTLRLTSGIVLRKQRTEDGFVIRFTGKRLSPDLIDAAMEELRRLFEAP